MHDCCPSGTCVLCALLRGSDGLCLPGLGSCWSCWSCKAWGGRRGALSNAGGCKCKVAESKFRCESNTGNRCTGVRLESRWNREKVCSVLLHLAVKQRQQPPPPAPAATEAFVSRLMVEVNCTGDSLWGNRWAQMCSETICSRPK